jgi:hypothetical protein
MWRSGVLDIALVSGLGVGVSKPRVADTEMRALDTLKGVLQA